MSTSCLMGNNEYKLVSDGQSMLLGFGHEQTIVMEDVIPVSFTIRHTCENIIRHTCENIDLAGIPQINLDVQLIAQKVNTIREADAPDYRFVSGLSVQELLDVINKKLKRRE